MDAARTQLPGRVELDKERRLPFASAHLARFEIAEPCERLLRMEGVYRLDMCITPRPAAVRARYADHWAARRFEPIGEVYVLPPGQTLQVRCVPSVTSSVVCELQADKVSQWTHGEVEWSDRQREASLSGGSPRFRPLLRRLVEELRQPGLAHEAMIELVTAQLALEISRFAAPVAAERAAGGLAPWRRRLIDERLSQGGPAPSLSELSRLCNMSVRQLVRGFRASRDCTIGEHIARTRADLAKSRLHGDESIKAIARSLGFGSPSSFTYAFRRAVGLTPRDYRALVVRGS
jgi:AraC family transcriptional regulator